MTAVAYADGGDGADVGPIDTDSAAADRTSRRWRSIWRIHFYAGMFSMPFIVLMAVTGLVILYTQPIQDLTEGDMRSVEAPAGAFYVPCTTSPRQVTATGRAASSLTTAA
jgi:hypothetical protein